MRRRTNNDSNEDEAVDPTTESQKVPSSVSYFNLLIIMYPLFVAFLAGNEICSLERVLRRLLVVSADHCDIHYEKKLIKSFLLVGFFLFHTTRFIPLHVNGFTMSP